MVSQRLKNVGWGTVMACLAAVAALTLLRWQRTRREAERVAGAAVTIAAASDVAAGERCARDLAPSMRFDWHVGHDVIACRATTHFDLPLLLLDGIEVPVSATATAPRLPPPPPPPAPLPPPSVATPPPPAAPAIGELARVTRVARKVPRVVLVLDYSGSMMQPMSGHGIDGGDPRTSFAALRSAVSSLLARASGVELGLVIFASQVMDALPIRADSAADVLAHVAAEHACPSQQPSCQTATWDALARAAELFAVSAGDEARYLILVSDGHPASAGIASSDGIERSRAAADALRRMGVTVFTVHIVNGSDPGGVLRHFMVSIGGSARDPGDPAFYRSAASEAEVGRILSSIVPGTAFTAGPLDLPARVDELRFVLRTTRGAETTLGPAEVALARRTLRVSARVAARVNQHGDTLIVRGPAR